MSDKGDDLLRALGASIRRTEGLRGEPWEKLARGELSPEEEQELAASATPGGGEASLYEIARPPAAEESREKTLALWAKHAAARNGNPGEEVQPEAKVIDPRPASASVPSKAKPVAEGARSPVRRNRWLVRCAAALAAVGAAGVCIWAPRVLNTDPSPLMATSASEDAAAPEPGEGGVDPAPTLEPSSTPPEVPAADAGAPDAPLPPEPAPSSAPSVVASSSPIRKAPPAPSSSPLNSADIRLKNWPDEPPPRRRSE